MIVEQAEVTAIDSTGAWVLTIRQSACDACSARAVCGQRLLNKATSETTQIHALFDPSQPKTQLTVGDSIEIGVPREVVALGSLWLYLVPVLALVLGALVGAELFNPNLGSFFGAVIGLGLSGVWLYRRARRDQCNPKLHPIILSSAIIAKD